MKYFLIHGFELTSIHESKLILAGKKKTFYTHIVIPNSGDKKFKTLKPPSPLSQY